MDNDDTKIASLSEEAEQKIKQLEQELGVLLVAYDNETLT